MPAEPAILAPAPAGTATVPPAGIQGAVDNVGAERIYGWAWHPDQPAERLRIEARIAGTVVVDARADFARPDLVPAGIGDGNHAFELRLTRDCILRKAELSIVAVAADGSEQTLPFRVKRTPAIAAAEARREAEQFAVEQREMREAMRSVVAALARSQRGADLGTAATQVAAAQAKLEERLGTLDIWLTRLDARLADLAAGQSAQPAPRRLDPWQLVLGAVIALAAGGGFATAMLLLGPGLG